MGLQRPKPTGHGAILSPPPSTPLAALSRVLPPVASTVNIHITNHNHFILTPPSTLSNQKHANRAAAASVQAENISYTSSPLLQRIAPFLSPLYSYLTPAATPRTVPVSPLTKAAEAKVAEARVTEAKVTGAQTVEEPIEVTVHVEEIEQVVTSEDVQDTCQAVESVEEEMPFSLSAAAGTRTLADRQTQLESSITSIPSSPPLLHQPTDDTEILSSELDFNSITLPTSDTDPTSVIETDDADLRRGAKPKQPRPRKRDAGACHPHHRKANSIPRCYNHDTRLPDEPEGVDVVPCDWVRPFNSQRFNNYTNGDVQCAIPKCDTCIATETYGPNSVWARTAPPGHTAESHRLRSRIRYLCSRCPQPAPAPPGNIGPIELCTCVLRDANGIPTDMWFQCRDCAEAAWFQADSKFGGPDGVLMSRTKARRRKNKYGVIVRPRFNKNSPGRIEWRVKRCGCGRIAPSDGRYGAWCTWCMCPVDGVRGMELGGAATNSGVVFAQDASNDNSGKKVKKAKKGHEDGEDSGIGM
ncbi:hypothetical protein ABW21_db0204888 [Orbilia brochopaga]|nr:hypothetical protein ABW21_db0204888 [Drechslerella brochopaga]